MEHSLSRFIGSLLLYFTFHHANLKFIFYFCMDKVNEMYYPRLNENAVADAIKNFPVVAITGPRQCGKSTMARHMLSGIDDVIFLDLERPSDVNKLNDPEWFFSSQKGKLICIDEVQRKPELFPIIRSLVDEWNRNGCFLILGSASDELLKQSSESLAGRIVYKNLTPFLWNEAEKFHSLDSYIHKGGFPRSLLADDEHSFDWRESFISTFLERDLQLLNGFSIPTMRRLWQMLANMNGQTANYTALASSLGVSSPTVKNYIDLLSGTFMIEIVRPFISNFGKRLVKSPKLYLTDSGITTALLHLENFEATSGHPVFGSLWEQIVLANLKGLFPRAEFFYYRTTNGAEVDFVMSYKGDLYAFECKASTSPSLTKGNFQAFDDINAKKSFIVAPISERWIMKPTIEVIALKDLSSIA